MVQGAKELLVGISATYQIKDTELNSIDPARSMSRVSLSVDPEMQGKDFFNSEQKITKLAHSMVSCIEEICKEHGIGKVHLAISASTAFTFKLAQLLHTNQMPEIVVYHYEAPSYPWAILIKENDCSKAMFFREKNEALEKIQVS